MRGLRSLLRCTSGAVLPEFAFVLPILAALVLGIIGCGELLYGYLAVEKAVRGGARYLARVQPGNAWGAQHAIDIATAEINKSGASSAVVTSVCGGANRCLQAQVSMPVNTLSIFGIASPITLTVRHDQPYIGE